MTDMDVMKIMAAENKDIGMSSTLVEVRQVKAGGHVTIGVSRDFFHKVMRSATGADNYYVALYVINKEQFDEIKKRDTGEEAGGS